MFFKKCDLEAYYAPLFIINQVVKTNIKELVFTSIESPLVELSSGDFLYV
jgi:hypothetical protein